jgi:magnesium chelatase accessory protein
MIPANWPYRDAGRMIRHAPHDWWVIDTGAGPTIILLHGAGGSTHSFRNLLPLLTPHYRCIVIDLPGQGFTRAGSRRFNLDVMATDLVALSQSQNWSPQAIIGHSAGAAIALRMAELIPLKAVIGINAALGTFDGLAGLLFPMLARGFALIPFLPTGIARLWGNPTRVNQLLDATGSQIDAAGRAQYLHLVQSATHVDGTLGMMSQWNLTPMVARLQNLQTPTLLLTGAGDTTVPSRVSKSAANRMPQATYTELPKLGHLAHEEAPDQIAEVILPWLLRQL